MQCNDSSSFYIKYIAFLINVYKNLRLKWLSIHSLWMVCSGFFLVTPLNDMFLERSWPIETEYLFKKIPAWHYLLVIFSKNWKYISKIIGNLKYGAKSKMEIFCKNFFMKFFMVQNVFWNFKNQYKKFLQYF